MAVERTSAIDRRPTGLWPSRLVSIYFVILGIGHLLGLGLAIYEAADIAAALPWWSYAVAAVYPFTRIASGISLLLGSRAALPLLCILAVFAGIALFGWSAIWEYQTGRPLAVAPLYVVLGRVDFLLILWATYMTFRWRARGLLR